MLSKSLISPHREHRNEVSFSAFCELMFASCSDGTFA